MALNLLSFSVREHLLNPKRHQRPTGPTVDRSLDTQVAITKGQRAENPGEPDYANLEAAL